MQLRLISTTRALQGWEAVGPPERVFREEAGAQQGLSPLLNHSSLQRGTDVHGLPPLGYNSISSPLFLIFVGFFLFNKTSEEDLGGCGTSFHPAQPLPRRRHTPPSSSPLPMLFPCRKTSNAFVQMSQLKSLKSHGFKTNKRGGKKKKKEKKKKKKKPPPQTPSSWSWKTADWQDGPRTGHQQCCPPPELSQPPLLGSSRGREGCGGSPRP